ncbi:MAG: nitrite reductase small subunit NirD [Thiomargarita sp.]|nr:nitrite reductase small subunit NirD [Thiomargarita sp.]
MSNNIRVGNISDIPSLGARVVKTEKGDIAIFRTEDNKVFALINKCPHKDGSLADGIVHGHKVTCPLHNWNINLEDGKVVAPDEGCAEHFVVNVDAEGNLFLQL